VNNLVWIIKFPHTHKSCEYLLICDVFMDFDGFVGGAADDDVVDGEDRTDS
jgi:hypothetical protein